MRFTNSTLVLVCCLPLVVDARGAHSDDSNFFKGKTIRIIVGTEAGGGYDAYARLVARHLGDQFPSHPNVIVENMIGAGGVVAANYVYSAAPKDGTVIATFPNDTPFIQIMGQPGPLFQASGFGWLGSLASETTVCAARVSAEIQNIDDLKRRPLVIGGSGPNNTETTPAVLNAVLGTKFNIVTGYASSTAIALAVDRGEVDGLCTSYNTIVTRNPDWITEKKVKILIQSGLRKNDRIPDVPLDMDLTQTTDDRHVLELNNARLELGRPFVAPPTLAAGRLDELRHAFNTMLRDQAFLSDAGKSGLESTPVDGVSAQLILDRVSQTSPQIIDRLNAALHYRIQAIQPK